MINRIFEEIERFDTITIFRHVAADPDALGSQFGLYTWIKETYPDKKVYALGEDLGSSGHLFPPIDKVDDEVVKRSLAILLDTANKERVDDKRYLLAKRSIRIDHHIRVDNFCDIEYIDEESAATCEILAAMFEEKSQSLSSACASYLYMGLLTDTLNFTTQNTTSRTIQLASFLKNFGVNASKLHFDLFSVTKAEYQYESYLRSIVKEYKGHIAYIVLKREDYEKFGLTYNEAKEKVYVMGNVREYDVWCLFVEDTEQDNIYNGSLRSRGTIVREVAALHNGGGHNFASGVKGLTLEEIDVILEELHNQGK